MPDSELAFGEGLSTGDLDRSKVPAPFLEAHPRLSAVEAASALQQGLGRCVWRWSGSGDPFAYADLEVPAAEVMIIRLECDLARREEQRETMVYLRQATHYVSQAPFSLFKCPKCKRSCKFIVYTWRWQCGPCSGLPYRSQRVGKEVAGWERRDALESEVGKGRPKGMHHRTYGKRVRELRHLRKTLTGEQAVAPLEYLHTLVAEWVRRPTAEKGLAPRDGLQACGGPIPRIVRVVPWLSEEDDEEL